MRLIMMGTGPFAAPTFRALYAAGHDVAALVTRPLRNVRDRYKGSASPLPPIAAEHGTPVIAPADVNQPEARQSLAALAAELLVVCDYGQILSPETLAATPMGGINLHGSLLPKYRGAAPINWAIARGETETGATVIHMTPRLDAGPAIAQVRTPIGPNETAPQVEARLADLGAPLVVESIDLLSRGAARIVPQDAALATRAPKLRKDEGAIDWSRPALEIHNRVRAFVPWPRSWSTITPVGGKTLRVAIDETRLSQMPAEGAAPGAVLFVKEDLVCVAAGEGAIDVRRVQPEGKRSMTAGEFARGYRVRAGDRFVSSPPGAAGP